MIYENIELFTNAKSSNRDGFRSVNNFWILLRHLSSKLVSIEFEQQIPPWTTFRKIHSSKVSFPTTIGNSRTMPASSRDTNVVYIMLLNVKNILEKIGHECLCVTDDESLYHIAKTLRWLVPALQDIT